jgi:hypothetical protein
MKRAILGVSVCFVLIAAMMLASCGSSPTLSLSAMGSASPAVDDGQVITITATTSSAQGVTWALTGAGALSNNTATSVTYTAPATGSTTVTVTATLVSGASTSKSIAIAVDAPPSITTTSLPDAVVGKAYSGGQITATGGAPSLTYSVSAGSLPAGLSLNASSGAITGTPAGPASTTPVNFTVKVTDSSTVAPQSASQALSITVSQEPAITSANTASFVVGTSKSFTVNATGTPTPSITESGALPNGVTFTDNGNGTGTLSGTPAAGTAANYTITFTANNSVGTAATQSFTLTVGQPPAITSASSTTLTAGTAGTFSVTTSGFPKPTLSETGALPSGVTFVDNGNGTATLSGTPAAGSGKQYSLAITASNGVGSNASQTFTLTVNETPAITSANKVTFTVLTAGTFPVTTSGYPTASITESGTLPTGVTFVDNGNGTGTLAGTPASGMAGSYPVTFTPSNGVGSPAAQTFTLTVGQAPAITSGASKTFTAGTAGSFTVTTSGFPKPTLSETGTLPSGVTFVDNGDGTATLSGTAAAATGKTYAITITASNGIGSNATQSFTLTVDEAPAITSANSTSFSLGGAGTFQVTTSGFPAPALSESGALPNGVTFVDNGNGTGTLSGTPAAGTNGTYGITFTANNGVGSNASQSFTLTVNTAPVFTSAANTTFTVGSGGSFSVTATGTPTPSISESGTLPSGVTFVDNGNGTGTLSGTPAATTGGTYTITFTASNGVGTNATQTFTLTVDQSPAITSANSATFTVGAAGSFTVQTTGTPTPSITETGSLPSGVTFTDNGNGTATLSGTPASGANGTYTITITASNTVGSNATQSFTLTVNSAPVFSSANNTTFTVGTGGSFTITATGNPTPTLTESGNLPSGVTFADNGNGTGTLSGTPAAGTGNVYNITINAQSTSGTTAQNFTLTVDEAPAFNSSSSATFFVSQNNSFQINATGYPQSGMTITEVGALPNGVTFTDNGNGSATLSGTPTTTTGSPWSITFTATNTTGITPQNFTLTVSSDPCASFSSGNESLLSGSYALLLKGFDDGNFSGENGQQEPALVGGVLTFNGTNNSGSITAGAIDLNLNGTAGLDSLTVNSGTYKVGSDHRACMALNLSDGTTEHYAVSLGGISSGVASTGHMISFDPASGTGTVFATGILKKQDTTAFSTSKVTGNYAFVFSSTQNTANSGGRFTASGQIKLSNGSITGGEADSNEDGVIDKNCGTFTSWPATACYSIASGGTYSIASNGRGSLSFTVNAGGKSNPQSMEIYVVSATDFFILQNSDQTLNTVAGGEALQQSGSFSKSTLNGTDILYMSGFDCGGNNCTIDQSNPNGTAGSNTVLAAFPANGSGGVSSGTFYSSSSGTIQTGSLSGATYSVDSNGRGTLTPPTGSGGSPLLFYLAGANRGWVISPDNGVASGGIEAQTATSVSGTYAVGSIDSVVPSGVSEVIATIASGSVSATSDNNDPQNGLQTQGQTISVSVDSTGFGELPNSGNSCTPTAGDCQFIFYVISPTRFVGMDGSGSNPKIQSADQ